MPSSLQEILQKLQKDTNELTIGSIMANNALSALLNAYEKPYTADRWSITQYVTAWTAALSQITDALEKFERDAGILGEYINDKG